MIIGTYRTDEVAGDHPLHQALGDIPADDVTTLSRAASGIGSSIDTTASLDPDA